MKLDNGATRDKRRIMIVEDSPTQAALLRHLLEENGYAVTEAESGKAALDCLKTGPQDLILSDIVMPEMDGYDLSRAIKGDQGLKHIPVILLTSLSDPEDIIRGLDSKVDSYLTKPWDESYLLSKVASMVAAPPITRDGNELQDLEVSFRGRTRVVTLAAQHALNLLFSTYENAVHINDKLLQTQMELKALNFDLENKIDEVEQQKAELVRINEALTQEVTERKRAEAQIRKLNEELEERVQQRTAELEASNQELREFAYIVSHDLKAPLRAVSQLAGWIADDHKDSLGESGKEMIDMMLSRLDRMHGLIEGILQYSRIGRIKEEEVEIDLAGLVREVTETLAPPAHIKVVVPSQLPTIKFERTRAAQLFQNLVGNAVKFMDKPEGLIRVLSEESDAEWKITVSDNGPGIDPKYHARIFQIFQTLAPRDEFESTGIGLTLVKKIVETVGGRIWVESAEGQGAAFHFALPKSGPTE
jgi:signal transduction histidine kinase